MSFKKSTIRFRVKSKIIPRSQANGVIKCFVCLHGYLCACECFVMCVLANRFSNHLLLCVWHGKGLSPPRSSSFSLTHTHTQNCNSFRLAIRWPSGGDENTVARQKFVQFVQILISKINYFIHLRNKIIIFFFFNKKNDNKIEIDKNGLVPLLQLAIHLFSRVILYIIIIFLS